MSPDSCNKEKLAFSRLLVTWLKWMRGLWHPANGRWVLGGLGLAGDKGIRLKGLYYRLSKAPDER